MAVADPITAEASEVEELVVAVGQMFFTISVAGAVEELVAVLDPMFLTISVAAAVEKRVVEVVPSTEGCIVQDPVMLLFAWGSATP